MLTAHISNKNILSRKCSLSELIKTEIKPDQHHFYIDINIPVITNILITLKVLFSWNRSCTNIANSNK